MVKGYFLIDEPGGGLFQFIFMFGDGGGEFNAGDLSFTSENETKTGPLKHLTKAT